MEKYDPILRALRDAKCRISDEIPTTEAEDRKIERALDILFDTIEEQLSDHNGQLSIHAETGMLMVTCKESTSTDEYVYDS